jgi:hypothetical protein
MTVVSTLDIDGLTAPEYRAVMDELGVEERAEPGIYLHLTAPLESGFRVVEIWDHTEGFDRSSKRAERRRARRSAFSGRWSLR